MIPYRLYIKDFTCHDVSDIHFDEFNSALIVGKVANNELRSNGVGKTSIFKAIEYGLFGESDDKLEYLIRDDTSGCMVAFDFIIEDALYRVVRKKNLKSSDLSFYRRTTESATPEEQDNLKLDKSNKFWKDISAKTASATEEEIFKLIKINYKMFRNTVHFVQNDFTGLATATASNRKAILKDSLNIALWSKLEKIAKEKGVELSKSIEKKQGQLSELGNPEVDIVNIKANIVTQEEKTAKQEKEITPLQSALDVKNSELLSIKLNLSNFEKASQAVAAKKQSALSEKEKIEKSIADYSKRKSDLIKDAKQAIESSKVLKTEEDTISKLDFSKINQLEAEILDANLSIGELSAKILQAKEKKLEVMAPLPGESICKVCKSTLTDEHRALVEENKLKALATLNETIASCEASKKKLEEFFLSNKKAVAELKSKQTQLEALKVKIATIAKEFADKKRSSEEVAELLKQFNESLEKKSKNLLDLEEEVKNSSNEEYNLLKDKFLILDQDVKDKQVVLKSVNDELTSMKSQIAVLQHNLAIKEASLLRVKMLKDELVILEKEYLVIPHIIKSFSPKGIPNLIIQNVLDDLQEQSNKLLERIKPGLQLHFLVEKTNSKGVQDDDLEIKYLLNGRVRQYEQLSGAQKLSVNFALKLGLSLYLQSVIGVKIKMLMLDEIDQALDKASIDSFAEIVKMFQDEFKILVITHNDRLKEKFQHAILVEQDVDMISKAKVVNSW